MSETNTETTGPVAANTNASAANADAANDYGTGVTGYGYHDQFDAEEIGEEIESLRPRRPEGRTTWAYLGFLGVLFVGLVGVSWACNDRGDTPGGATNSVAIDQPIGGELVPSNVTIAVDGDIVTLRGSVPDESARDQMVVAATGIYDSARLIDDITVDENFTLDGGTIRVTGVAAEDDERPTRLKDALIGEFGLNDGGTELQRLDAALRPVNMEIQVSVDGVSMLGQVPDEVSIDDLAAAAGALWPAAVVDTQLLEASDTQTWEDGLIRVTGALPPDDNRHEQLVGELQDRIGALVRVDVSGVGVDTSIATVASVEAEIAELLAAEPILFAPQSSDIDPVSDETLVAVADRLGTLPEVQVEVVGHTDDLGPEDENLALSISRAEAVVARMVELGVDQARLSARGEGESSPLVDEDTPEARELNRRIEFLLVGG